MTRARQGIHWLNKCLNTIIYALFGDQTTKRPSIYPNRNGSDYSEPYRPCRSIYCWKRCKFIEKTLTSTSGTRIKHLQPWFIGVNGGLGLSDVCAVVVWRNVILPQDHLQGVSGVRWTNDSSVLVAWEH